MIETLILVGTALVVIIILAFWMRMAISIRRARDAAEYKKALSKKHETAVLKTNADFHKQWIQFKERHD